MGRLTGAIIGVALGLGLAEFIEGDEEAYLLIDELIADNDALVNRIEDCEDVCPQDEIQTIRERL